MTSWTLDILFLLDSVGIQLSQPLFTFIPVPLLEDSNQLRSCPFRCEHSSLIRTHVFDTLCGRFFRPAVKTWFNRNQNMPCIRFRVDNKAPFMTFDSVRSTHIVGLRTSSNAVRASQANSFYSLRLGQLWCST